MQSRRLVPAALAVLVLSGFVLAGCGSSSSSSSSSSQATGPRSWTLAQVLRLSGLRGNAAALPSRLPAHPQCPVPVLLRPPAEVQTYKASGDPIATTPARSAGVSVDPDEPASCKRVFTQALA